MKILLLLSLLLTCVFLASCTSKLNLPRVLLPLFNKYAANYSLEVSDGGCYEWQLSRLDVIQIIPLDVSPTGCSSRALISTISRELARNTVIVIAEDVQSGQTLRCDIIVDTIESLHIVTKTRELFMEEAPELFEVRAYDSQGNEFSTLDNVEFQWNIGTGNTRAEQNVLRFMLFKDSPYETPATVKNLDQNGQKGHMVLLEGLKTGSAKVSVNLPNSEYRHVLPAEVNLMVVANLLIDPPDVYVLKGDTVKFRLMQIRHGRIQEVSIPSSQYILTIENKTIAENIDSRGKMLALEDGRTKIILQYSNDVTIRLPHAFITVTGPEYLALSLLPHRNWVVEVSTLYTIVVEVYDKANRKFHLGGNVKINAEIDPEYFVVKSKSKNGTYYHGYPIKSGITTLYAKLLSIGSHVYQPPLTTREEMSIFTAVVVTPNEYILPWEQNLNYRVNLEATGGDGSYIWSSSNTKVATVTQNGLVNTLRYGEINITAAMTRNIDNRGSSRVVITKPTRLQIVDRFSLEAEVSQPIGLLVALYAEDENGNEIVFTHCQRLTFQVIIEDPSFHYDETFNRESNTGISCTNLAVVGSRIGSTQVTVRYRIGNIVLEDSAIVGTYNPLITIQPVKGQTVLSIGTSRHLVFSGGPTSSNLKKGTKKVDYDSNIVDVFEVDSGSSDMYIYSVLCKRIGQTVVKVVIGSCGTADCKRAESISIVKVYCSEPKLVSFQFDPISPECPLKSEIDRVTVLNYKELNVNVIVKDNKGRVFDNVTSLYAEWVISNSTLAGVRYPGIVWLNVAYEPSYLIPLNHFQTISPKNTSGLVEVAVRILHYRTVLLKKLNIQDEVKEFKDEISSTAIINFVEDTIVSNNHVILFNRPNNKVSISVLPGSGHYKISSSSNSIAQFVWDTTDKHTLFIIPKSAGRVRLTIQDLCLQSKPADISVEIRQVNSIRAEMINKIQEGKHVLCAVKLYDSNDSILPITQVDSFDLETSTSERGIIRVKQQSVNLQKSEIIFQVDGLQIGTTNLIFSTTFGRIISSQPESVMVYPPLRISPKHIIVPINSKFHVDTTGGPYPDCTFEFTSENDYIRVSNNGIIEGLKLGSTKITGMAVGYMKSNKNKIIFSKDTVEVTVVQLEGIKINIPLLKFVQGAIVPLYASGLPDDLSPMVLSTLTPRLSFKWSVSSDAILFLSDVTQPLGVQVKEEDRVSMRLTALKPGKSVVSLKVFNSNNQVFSDSIQIDVFEDLVINKIPPVSLLLSPDASYQLKTNKDTSQLSYTILSNKYFNEDKVVASYNADIIKVSNKGLIRALKTGRSILSVAFIGKDIPNLSQEIVVYVKPVQYVMMQVKSRLQANPDIPILALPEGMKLEFDITLHDNYGRQFDAAKHEVKVQTNRNDLAMVKKISNDLLFADLTLAGESVMNIWDESLLTKPKDYVKISVDHLISPQKNHLVSGDVTCFTIPKICKEGSWSSSHPDIFTIDSDSGIGRARNKPGTVIIQHYLPECDISTKTILEILPINSIHFIPTKNKTITNALDQSFKADLVLFSNYEVTTSKSNNLISGEMSKCRSNDNFSIQNYPFTCDAKFLHPPVGMPLLEEVFDVQPSFSMKTGLYSCEFHAKLNLRNNALFKTDIILKASSIRGSITSQPISFTFYPAAEINTNVIRFKNNRPATITITALPDILEQITLTSSHENYLKIEKKATGMTTSGSSTSTIFQIQPLTKSWSEPRHDLVVYMYSLLTNQLIKIPVDLGVTSSPSTSSTCETGSSWFSSSCTTQKYTKDQFSLANMNVFFLIICIITFVIAIFLVYQCFDWIQKNVNNSSNHSENGNIQFNNSMKNLTSPPLPKPVYASSPIYSPKRRSFDEVSPVYGSPTSSVPRRRLPNISQLSNNSAQDNSWSS